MIRSTFQLLNIDNMEATMTITMTLREWRKVSTQLSMGGDISVLSNHINELILLAAQRFSLRYEQTGHGETVEREG
jgi:hypothetical protein